MSKSLPNGFYYFAHPYTCKDENGNNVHAGEEANFKLNCIRAAELLRRGYAVYAPICHTHPIHVSDPEFLANNEWHKWIELDEQFMQKTDFDGIILAPGWENSTGCNIELKTFQEIGKEVLLYADIIKEAI